MDRLGHPSAPSLSAPLEQDTLSCESRTHALRDRLLDPADATDAQVNIQALYGVTHEILALTDSLLARESVTGARQL